MEAPETDDRKTYKINYTPILLKHTWWTDVKGRTWVIVDRSVNVMQQGDRFIYTGFSITLLELAKNEPVVRPWEDVVKMIEAGKFVQFRPDPNIQQYSIKT